MTSPRSGKSPFATNVGPHAFKPLTWRDGWMKRGRCKHCHVARCRHDAAAKWWLPARAIGDRSWPSLPEVHDA